jgi:hypothetical protein
MATGDLASALAALQFAPTETPYGLAGATLAQSLPSLITPTTKPAQALGITLGGALIASLLGYQGQKQATQMGLEAAKQGARLAELPTATERAAYIESLPDVTGRTQIQNALLQYNQQLAAQNALGQIERQKQRHDVVLEAIKQGYRPTDYEDLFKTPITGEVTNTVDAGSLIGTDAITGQKSIQIPSTINGVPLTPKEKKDLQKTRIELEMGQQVKEPERKDEFFNREYTRLKPAGEEYSKVAQQFQAAVNLSKQDTIASAQALAKLMVKIPDPTSVVSRAEQNAAADVQSVRRKYTNLIDQWIAGGSGFDQTAYNDMLRAASVFVDASGKNYNTLAQGSIKRAKKKNYITNETDDLSDFLPVPLYNPTQLSFDKKTNIPSTTKPPLSRDQAMRLAKARGLIK